jgi:PilZ domain
MSVTSSAGERPAPERRAAPRIPVGIPVRVTSGDRSCAGRVLDASLTGLLVELTEPLAFVEADVVVALVLPEAGRHDVDAEIVRRVLGDDGKILLALRLAGRRPPPLGAPRRTAPRRSPPPGWHERERPRAVALAELRALGTRAYELALVDPEAAAPAPMVAWIGRLAAELEIEPPRRPTACRDLVTAVSDLNRRAHQDQSPAQPL